MLIDPEFCHDPAICQILAVVGEGDSNAVRLDVGLYQIRHFSLVYLLQRTKWHEFPELDEEHCAYGVCDSPSQFMASTVGQFVRESPREFVVSFTRVTKSAQSNWGGWRWHKWGPYIGLKTPTCEYLYDEPEIDEIYVYAILERSLAEVVRVKG